MRIVSLLVLLMLVGCASVEADRSSFDIASLSRSKMDFRPLNRSDRDRLLLFEKESLAKNLEPLQRKLDEVSAARAERYRQIKDQFPDCQRQKHCISALAFAGEGDFERYTQLTKSLQEFDFKAVDLEAEIRAWRNRYELRSRAIYNRFIVYELSQVRQANPGIANLNINALEAFDTRRALSERLLRYTELLPATWGDLNFSMFGKPIDEAAVVATVEIVARRVEDEKPVLDQYIATFLINAQAFDSLDYDRGMMRFWADKFVEPQQLWMRQQAMCSIYAIGGDMLVPRLPVAKAEPCSPLRAKYQKAFLPGLTAVEDWVLPLGYFRVINQRK